MTWVEKCEEQFYTKLIQSFFLSWHFSYLFLYSENVWHNKKKLTDYKDNQKTNYQEKKIFISLFLSLSYSLNS